MTIDKAEVGEADWKAIIEDRSESDGMFDVALTFFNETLGEKFPGRLRISTSAAMNALLTQARDVVAHRPEREARKSEIVVGMVLDLAPLPPPEVVPPTDDELARTAFFAAKAAYEDGVRFEPFGFDASALRAVATRLFKPEYVGLV